MIIHSHLSLSGPSLQLHGGCTEIYTEVAVSSRGVTESSWSATFLGNCYFLSVLTLYRSFTVLSRSFEVSKFLFYMMKGHNLKSQHCLSAHFSSHAEGVEGFDCQVSKKWASEHTERPLKVVWFCHHCLKQDWWSLTKTKQSPLWNHLPQELVLSVATEVACLKFFTALGYAAYIDKNEGDAASFMSTLNTVWSQWSNIKLCLQQILDLFLPQIGRNLEMLILIRFNQTHKLVESNWNKLYLIH